MDSRRKGMGEVERIVEGLTRDMRSAVSWPKEIDGRVQIIPNTLYAQTIAGLARRGLIDGGYFLTSLGLQVRAALASMTLRENGGG
jgi:hypothetical protein